MKLLLVTDSPQTVRQLTRLLDPSYSHIRSYELRDVRSVAEAMTELQTYPARIVFLDLHTPHATLAVPAMRAAHQSKIITFSDSQTDIIGGRAAIDVAAAIGSDAFISKHIAVETPALLHIQIAFMFAKLHNENKEATKGASNA